MSVTHTRVVYLTHPSVCSYVTHPSVCRVSHTTTWCVCHCTHLKVCWLQHTEGVVAGTVVSIGSGIRG